MKSLAAAALAIALLFTTVQTVNDGKSGYRDSAHVVTAANDWKVGNDALKAQDLSSERES